MRIGVLRERGVGSELDSEMETPRRKDWENLTEDLDLGSVVSRKENYGV